jgi:hypothetical protein
MRTLALPCRRAIRGPHPAHENLNQTTETPGAIARAAENPSNLQNQQNVKNPM